VIAYLETDSGALKTSAWGAALPSDNKVPMRRNQSTAMHYLFYTSNIFKNCPSQAAPRHRQRTIDEARTRRYSVPNRLLRDALDIALLVALRRRLSNFSQLSQGAGPCRSAAGRDACCWGGGPLVRVIDSIIATAAASASSPIGISLTMGITAYL
jgi:hypothetical protein